MDAKPPAWLEFEKEVAAKYRNLGALNVVQDVDIEGNQIDVYAEVPSYDGGTIRTIVSCKYYGKKVGIAEVNEMAAVFRVLRSRNRVDAAVIVTNKGFSRQAKAAATVDGIRLKELSELGPPPADFRAYLELMTSRLQSEPVFASNLYVPLRLRCGTVTFSDVDQCVQHFLGQEESLLVILGDYGTGKTTLSKSLFLNAASDYKNNPADSRMPVYISLRDYTGHVNISSLLLSTLISTENCRCNGEPEVKRMTFNGEFLVILDAFDEMASRNDLATTLRNFRQIASICGGESKAILTCRTHFFSTAAEQRRVLSSNHDYPPNVFGGPAYIEAHVQPFSESDIKQYLQSALGETWSSSYEAIRNTYDLLGLAARPIMLEMITSVLPQLVAEKQAIHPVNLYAKYVQKWLYRDDWRVQVSREWRQRFTIAFAHQMYLANASRYSWDVVRQAIRRMWPAASMNELEVYEHDIRTCTFIRRDGDEFEFVHKSFMEYFVAVYLYEKLVSADVDPWTQTTYNDEVLQFVGDHPATSQITQVLVGWLAGGHGESLQQNVTAVLSKMGFPQGSRFVEVTFADRVVSDAQWSEIIFNESKLLRCSFKRANWKGCTLGGGSMVSCEVLGSAMEGVSFSTVGLSHCQFVDVMMNEFVCDDASINECSFKDNRSTGVRLTSCDLVRVVVDGGGMPIECQGVKMTECKFRCVDMRVSNVEGGRVVDCTFEKCNLERSTFRFCMMRDCVFDQESLNGVTFDKVDFDATQAEKLLRSAGSEAKWQKAPQVNRCVGLTDEDCDKLEKAGFKVTRVKKGKSPVESSSNDGPN